jgi:hypothetical protein
MSRLTSSLLLHRILGALLLTSGNTVTLATTGRARSLPSRHILADILVADILVSFTGILLNYHLFSGKRRIIHLDLLVPVARSHTFGTPSAGPSTSHQHLPPTQRTRMPRHLGLPS